MIPDEEDTSAAPEVTTEVTTESVSEAPALPFQTSIEDFIPMPVAETPSPAPKRRGRKPKTAEVAEAAKTAEPEPAPEPEKPKVVLDNKLTQRTLAELEAGKRAIARRSVGAE